MENMSPKVLSLRPDTKTHDPCVDYLVGSCLFHSTERIVLDSKVRYRLTSGIVCNLGDPELLYELVSGKGKGASLLLHTVFRRGPSPTG